TLLLISHDVYLLRELANRVVHVNAGRLTIYPGDYQYYLDKTSTIGSATAPSYQRETATVAPVDSRRMQKRLEAEQRQARSRQLRDQQKRGRGLETKI